MHRASFMTGRRPTSSAVKAVLALLEQLCFSSSASAVRACTPYPSRCTVTTPDRVTRFLYTQKQLQSALAGEGTHFLQSNTTAEFSKGCLVRISNKIFASTFSM